MEGYQCGRRRGSEKKVQRISTINGRQKYRQGEVKNSIGNVEAKDLICMTHGHDVRWGNDGGGCAGCRGIKGRKNGTTVIA